MMKLSKNISYFRKQKGLTQEELADRLGLTVGSISKWETGSTLPDLNRIMELAQLFDVSLDQLVGFTLSKKNFKSLEAEIRAHLKKKEFEEAIEKSEKAVFHFSNHYKAHYLAAISYYLKGIQQGQPSMLRKALQQFQKTRQLYKEDTSKEVDLLILAQQMAICYSELHQIDKALDLLDQYNMDCHNSLMMANLAASSGNDRKILAQAEDYWMQARPRLVTDFLTGCLTQVMISCQKEPREEKKAREAIEIGLQFIDMIRLPEKKSYLDRLQSMFLTMKALILWEKDEDHGKTLLRAAWEKALAFDADPDYSFENIRIFQTSPAAILSDNLGRTTVLAMKEILKNFDSRTAESGLAYLQQLKEENHE